MSNAFAVQVALGSTTLRPRSGGSMNRREFLQTAGLTVGGMALGGCTDPLPSNAKGGYVPLNSAKVVIITDPSDPVASAPSAQWAVEKLRNALAGRNVPTAAAGKMDDAPLDAVCVIAAGRANSTALKIAGEKHVSLPR